MSTCTPSGIIFQASASSFSYFMNAQSPNQDEDELEQAYCSVGAIMEAAGPTVRTRGDILASPVVAKALLALSKVVQETVGKRQPDSGVALDAHDYVVAFNDGTERTWPEVRSAFRRAIKQLKAA